MLRVLVTTDFCKGCKQLVSSNSKDVLNNLRTVLIKLVNEQPIPKKYRDHQLRNSPYRELHLSGDDLLLYSYSSNGNTLKVSLKLSDITNHKGLRTKSSQDNHEYFEVDTTFLHDITSSVTLDEFDKDYINDFLESISDYSSTYNINGYILLENYHLDDNNNLHSIYSFHPYSISTEGNDDDVDFVIDLNKYVRDDIFDLDNYIEEFSKQVAFAFS